MQEKSQTAMQKELLQVQEQPVELLDLMAVRLQLEIAKIIAQCTVLQVSEELREKTEELL